MILSIALFCFFRHRDQTRFDVVCVAEAMDRCVAQIALALGCDVRDWLYHSENRVLGRPTFEDLPPVLQERLHATVGGKECSLSDLFGHRRLQKDMNHELRHEMSDCSQL